MSKKLQSQSDAGLVALGSLLYTAGSAFQYITPAYFGELSTKLGITEAQMGSITAGESIGIALASILSVLWLSRVNRRILAVVGAVLCAAFNLFAFFTRSLEWLVVARFLTGFFGEGVLFTLAFIVLGATRNPDRSFGIGLTSVVMFGSLVLGTSTYLARVPYGTGILVPLAIVSLAVLFLIRWMPQRPLAAPSMLSDAHRSTGRFAIVAIAGMAVWFAAPGAFWTFAESAAAARNIPAGSISVALAVGNAVGLLGSAMAAWQGDRWGRFRPLMIATVCLGVSVIAFQESRSVVALAVALSAFNAFWNYGAVYEMALIVAQDSSGRAALAISAAQVMGFAGGGFLSGLVISQSGYGALPIVVATLAGGGMLMLAFCFRVPKLAPRHS